jgi:hypothetical protein
VLLLSEHKESPDILRASLALQHIEQNKNINTFFSLVLFRGQEGILWKQKG